MSENEEKIEEDEKKNDDPLNIIIMESLNWNSYPVTPRTLRQHLFLLT